MEPRARRFLMVPAATRAAFTLIELLLVVGIIAILAAIAIPNLLEAQVRAKIARAKSDMRTIATCLESYSADNNRYPPNDGYYNVVPPQLSTPVAYLTENTLADPFGNLRHPEKTIDPETKEVIIGPDYGQLARYYTYDLIVTWEECLRLGGTSNQPANEGVDAVSFNYGALDKYGKWRLVSNGPDRSYADPHFQNGSDPTDPNNVLRGADVPYDPTNGTISLGNIIRTQKEAQMTPREPVPPPTPESTR